MAKVNVEFDTVSKALAVTMDGKPMDNVVGVNLYRSYDDDDEYSCSVQMLNQDEVADTRTMTCVYASEGKRPEHAVASDKFPGCWVEIKAVASKAARDIAAYFAKG